MKKIKIETRMYSLEGPKARANKTGINFMIFILLFVENCLSFDAIHKFSVWWIVINFEAILEK